MSEIKDKLKKYWNSLDPLVKYSFINSIITSKKLNKDGLTFEAKLMADDKYRGRIELTIGYGTDILKIISEERTFPKNYLKLLEESIQIINEMINREIEDNDRDALEDAFSSLRMSDGIEMMDLAKDGVSQKAGKTRKKRKKRTKKHLKPNKRMSRKK